MKKKLIKHSKILGVLFISLANSHNQCYNSSLVMTLLEHSLVLKYPHRKNGEDSSQVSVQAKKLELHMQDHSRVQDNFWTAINTLRNYNVVEWNHTRRHIRKETSSVGPL
jgi:hypothetical protein